MKILAIGDPHGDLKKVRKIKIKMLRGCASQHLIYCRVRLPAAQKNYCRRHLLRAVDFTNQPLFLSLSFSNSFKIKTKIKSLTNIFFVLIY